MGKYWCAISFYAFAAEQYMRDLTED